MNIAGNITGYNLVIDLGSSSVKADLASKTLPTVVFDSIIGRPKFNKIIPTNTEFEVVAPIPEIRGLYHLSKPIQRGVLKSEQDAKAILNKVYSELSVMHRNESPVFMTEPTMNSINQKKMLTEMLFNDFEVPLVFFGTQSVLSLYAFGKTDGIIVESGDGITQISTVLNGYKIDNGSDRINFGGSDVTDFLKVLFKKAGTFINSSSEDAIFNEIKKSVCQVNTNYIQKAYSLQKAIVPDAKTGKNEELSYTLPDGKTIQIGMERFLAAELMFNSSLGGFEFPGVAELLEGVISKIDIDLTKSLSNTIYLAGGNTQITGFVDRFAKEVSSFVAEKTARMLIVPNINRAWLAWQGGAIVSNLNSFSKLWISKKDFEEHGNRIFSLRSF